MRHFGRWLANKKGAARAKGRESGARGRPQRGFISRSMRALSQGSGASDPAPRDRRGGGGSPLRACRSAGCRRAWGISTGHGGSSYGSSHAARRSWVPSRAALGSEIHRTRDEASELIASVIHSLASNDGMRLNDFVKKNGGWGSLCDHRDSDLLLALVLRGVTKKERKELWLFASGGKKLMHENPQGHYARLKTPAALATDDETTVAAIRQIDLDVGRTKGLQKGKDQKDHGDQNNVSSSGLEDIEGLQDGIRRRFRIRVSLKSLRSVLVATSRHLPHIGYCQSMNFLAAMLLEHLDEEEAFWVLVSMANDMLSGYYTLSLIGCRVDQRVFADLVMTVMPDVSSKVDDVMGLPSVGILSYHWFLTIFLTTIENHDTLMQIWDVFL